MIMPTEVGGVFTETKGNTLGTFASYFLCEGQQQAEDLGYSPLPMNLVQAGFDQVKRIPGAGPRASTPTRATTRPSSPATRPSNNQLALTAPQPADCDKRGPNQCTTGTAGATQDTPVDGVGRRRLGDR